MVLDDSRNSMILKGFKATLQKLADNLEPNLKFTHKEVRAYARSLLVSLDSVEIPYNFNCSTKEEVSLHLLALSCSGLAHYDRAFLARQVLEVIQEQEKLEADKREYHDFEDYF